MSPNIVVNLAAQAHEELKDENINVRVVSMPSMELFDAQNPEYKEDILNKTRNLFLEAGSTQSWNKWMKKNDILIGIDNFGVSGPGKEVFSHFKISVNRIKNDIITSLKMKKIDLLKENDSG